MASPWQSAPDGYRLNHCGLTGRLVLRGLAPGLEKLTLPFSSSSGRLPGRLLAVRTLQASGTKRFQIGFHTPRLSQRLRTSLVDVQSDSSARCPARLHLYWSAAKPRQIDLEVLVTTTDPFGKLEVLTSSVLPRGGKADTAELLVQSSNSKSGWVNVGQAIQMGSDCLVVPRDHEAALLSLDGRSPHFNEFTLTTPFRHPLVLYRPSGQNWSYVEMNHPEDCARVVIYSHRGTLEWCFGLFGLDVEKGVILRGRIRGAFMSRRGDLGHAARLFEEFVEEPPRLSV